MDYNGLVELADSSTDSAALGLGSFKLIDNRDSKPYLVRRLADGNCWMAQNLMLDLNDFAFTHGINSSNTDLKTKEYWDPAESMYNHAVTLSQQDGYDGPSVSTSNYFEIASKDMIGVKQHYQFQPINISGTVTEDGQSVSYVWQSYYHDVDGVKTLDETTYNNQYADMPRSYSRDLSYVDLATTTPLKSDEEWTAEHAGLYLGNLYNAYARLAGRRYGMPAIGNPDNIDSICAKGWRLPSYQSNSKAIRTLWGGVYGGSLVQDGYERVAVTTSIPISLNYTGTYNMYGNPTYGSYGNYPTGESWTITSQGFDYYVNSIGGASEPHSIGYAIRCVNKGSNQETVVSTCAANSICYNSNGGSGSMDNQSVTAAETPADTSAMLTAPSFTRTGYAFAGWSTSSTGYGTTYGPNETVTVGDLSQNGLQLYARWVKSSGTFQDFTAARCNTMKEHETVALTDVRDGNVYLVAKLKDDNCWMSTNLALDLGTADVTAENTNNPAQAFLNDIENIASSNSWCGLDDAACLNRTLYNTDMAKVVNQQIPDEFGPGSMLYGYHYNWHAATAGNGGYQYPEATTETAGDICPSGWHIPSGIATSEDDPKEFSSLAKIYSGGVRVSGGLDPYYDKYPLNYLYSALYNNNSNGLVINQLTPLHRIWASTSYSDAEAGILAIDKNRTPYETNIGSYSKGRGYSVRCVKTNNSVEPEPEPEP